MSIKSIIKRAESLFNTIQVKMETYEYKQFVKFLEDSQVSGQRIAMMTRQRKDSIERKLNKGNSSPSGVSELEYVQQGFQNENANAGHEISVSKYRPSGNRR